MARLSSTHPFRSLSPLPVPRTTSSRAADSPGRATFIGVDPEENQAESKKERHRPQENRVEPQKDDVLLETRPSSLGAILEIDLLGR
jgi:hypothetical protein